MSLVTVAVHRLEHGRGLPLPDAEAAAAQTIKAIRTHLPR